MIIIIIIIMSMSILLLKCIHSAKYPSDHLGHHDQHEQHHRHHLPNRSQSTPEYSLETNTNDNVRGCAKKTHRSFDPPELNG